MKESLAVRFLYQTATGRLLLKLLVRPGVSKMAGVILSSGISKHLAPYYIRKYNIDMDDIEIPPGGFASFQDFFTRKRKGKCPDSGEGHLISPCDGLLTMVRISGEAVFEIKHTRYSLQDLLNDRDLAQLYEDGMALIFRLTPADYHRYCYPVGGEILSSKKIQGILHCVRPIALETIPVYIQNSREYQVIRTETFGTMVQMEIGALLVGKISNHKNPLEKKFVQAGEEKGYFEFGGSTILLLFQKDVVCMNENWYEKHSHRAEAQVRMGELLISNGV